VLNFSDKRLIISSCQESTDEALLYATGVSIFDNPYGCGRILLNESEIIGIREEKDCNEEEKKIKLVNCGIYQIKIIDLLNFI
jgi:bifunctional N-acetylglucosamine-1-phosphate-uridyltransferase/glucosamine-1-phosphate-acetyltransferase GlmU-like protein